MTQKCISDNIYLFLNTHRELTLQAIFSSNVSEYISAKINGNMLIESFRLEDTLKIIESNR